MPTLDLPIIGITIGDAAGIGPEITLKALSDSNLLKTYRPVIIGDIAFVRKASSELGLDFDFIDFTGNDYNPQQLEVFDLHNLPENVIIGEDNGITGKASAEYIKAAVELWREKKIDAIATAPISKKAIGLGGYNFPGHTEFLAELTSTKQFAIITDLIITPGIINLDFADVTTVMRGRGVALMGIGTADGPDAASKAMRAALDYKLLEENSISGAKAALINVTGGPDMPLGEIEDAIGMIEEESDDNADIIWGTVIKEGMGDEIKVTVIATGFDSLVQSMMPLPRTMETQAVAGNQVYTNGDNSREENLDVPTFIRRQAD
jgi:hypothetical protein